MGCCLSRRRPVLDFSDLEMRIDAIIVTEQLSAEMIADLEMIRARIGVCAKDIRAYGEIESEIDALCSRVCLL